MRHKLGFQLVAELRRPDGTIPLIQLAPEWDELFAQYQIDGERGAEIALPPSEFNKLAGSVAEKIASVGEGGIYPALITSTRRRRYLRTVMAAKGIPNAVLSYDEIGADARPAIVGMVAA